MFNGWNEKCQYSGKVEQKYQPLKIKNDKNVFFFKFVEVWFFCTDFFLTELDYKIKITPHPQGKYGQQFTQ